MNRKTNTRLNGLALALLLAAGSATAFAQGSAFTYQGKLQSSGQNVNSTSDIQFSVFDADVGGSEVTSPVTQLDVEVIDGLFTTFVDFGSNLFSQNQTLFLEIAVRNPAGSGPFVPLTTRQLLTPAPFSLATRGLSVAPWEDLGIGTTAPQSRLHVKGSGFTTGPTAPYGIFETEASSFSGNQFGPQVRLRHGGPGGQDWVMVSNGAGNGPAGSFQLVRSGAPNAAFVANDAGWTGLGRSTPVTGLATEAFGIATKVGNTGFNGMVIDSAATTGSPYYGYSVGGQLKGWTSMTNAGTFDVVTNNQVRLNVTSAGNVGIGNFPSALLDVGGAAFTTSNDPLAVFRKRQCGAPCGEDSYTEVIRLLNDSNFAQAGMGFMVEFNSTISSTPDVWIGTGFEVDAGDQSNDFIIATKTGATTLTNRVRVNGDNGNVGIGTNAPAARLHNVGTTRLDGSLQFGADLQNGNTLKWGRFDGAPGSTLATLDISPVTVANSSAFAISRNGSQVFLFQLDGVAAKLGGGAWGVLSDERSKNDIQPMTGTLDRLLQLKGHSYTYKSEFVETGRALPGTQIGLVAQEVEAIFPDWVSTGPDGLKQVTERSTTALMVEALRDLRTEKDAEIATLKARLEKLEAAIAAQSSK